MVSGFHRRPRAVQGLVCLDPKRLGGRRGSVAGQDGSRDDAAQWELLLQFLRASAGVELRLCPAGSGMAVAGGPSECPETLGRDEECAALLARPRRGRFPHRHGRINHSSGRRAQGHPPFLARMSRGNLGGRRPRRCIHRGGVELPQGGVERRRIARRFSALDSVLPNAVSRAGRQGVLSSQRAG